MNTSNTTPQEKEIDIEQIETVLSFQETNVELAHRQQLIRQLYEAYKASSINEKKVAGENTLSPVSIGNADQFPVEGLPHQWNTLWSEIGIWYGDPKKTENAEEFLQRMQANYSLTYLNSLPNNK